MTEKEKRDKGELYNLANDEELTIEMRKCKLLCYEYNHIKPDKMEERKVLIKKILGSTGENLQVESNFYCDYGYNIHVGENFYVNHNCVILDVGKVEFGDNVFIGPNCGFYTAGHPLDVEIRNQGLEYGKSHCFLNNIDLTFLNSKRIYATNIFSSHIALSIQSATQLITHLIHRFMLIPPCSLMILYLLQINYCS